MTRRVMVPHDVVVGEGPVGPTGLCVIVTASKSGPGMGKPWPWKRRTIINSLCTATSKDRWGLWARLRGVRNRADFCAQPDPQLPARPALWLSGQLRSWKLLLHGPCLPMLDPELPSNTLHFLPTSAKEGSLGDHGLGLGHKAVPRPVVVAGEAHARRLFLLHRLLLQAHQLVVRRKVRQGRACRVEWVETAGV